MRPGKIFLATLFMLLAMTPMCFAWSYVEFHRTDDGYICYADPSSLEKAGANIWQIAVLVDPPGDVPNVVAFEQIDFAMNKLRILEMYDEINGNRTARENVDTGWHDIQYGEMEYYLKEYLENFLRRRGKL